jgi:hypothetical protein
VGKAAPRTPEFWGIRGYPRTTAWAYHDEVDNVRAGRARREVAQLAKSGLDWVNLASAVSDSIARVVPFDRSCWHTVDPGTVLFTGSVNRDIACSGSWLAEHEYVIEDVNKWSFLANSGRYAGATSLATHGDLSRCVRHRSQATYGIGDELRISCVADGTYWAAAGFLRDHDRPWFSEDDVRFLASLSKVVADGFRRALVRTVTTEPASTVDGPGVVVFDTDFASRLRFLQRAYIARSKPVHADQWERRGWATRLTQNAAGILSPLL